jgi:hypothetical protein
VLVGFQVTPHIWRFLGRNNAELPLYVRVKKSPTDFGTDTGKSIICAQGYKFAIMNLNLEHSPVIIRLESKQQGIT